MKASEIKVGDHYVVGRLEYRAEVLEVGRLERKVYHSWDLRGETVKAVSVRVQLLKNDGTPLHNSPAPKVVTPQQVLRTWAEQEEINLIRKTRQVEEATAQQLGSERAALLTQRLKEAGINANACYVNYQVSLTLGSAQANALIALLAQVSEPDRPEANSHYSKDSGRDLSRGAQ